MEVLPPIDETISQRRLSCINEAGKTSLIKAFQPPPSAAEIDRLQEVDLHREICQQIQESVEDAFPNDGKTGYSNVYVLLICWKNEDPKLPVTLELDELEGVFSEYYGFQTEKWTIPEEGSHNQLNRKILDFIELGDDSRRDLKIVYYGGHGMLNKGRQPVWAK